MSLLIFCLVVSIVEKGVQRFLNVIVDLYLSLFSFCIMYFVTFLFNVSTFRTAIHLCLLGIDPSVSSYFLCPELFFSWWSSSSG
jgi:hypothetical protein